MQAAVPFVHAAGSRSSWRPLAAGAYEYELDRRRSRTDRARVLSRKGRASVGDDWLPGQYSLLGISAEHLDDAQSQREVAAPQQEPNSMPRPEGLAGFRSAGVGLKCALSARVIRTLNTPAAAAHGEVRRTKSNTPATLFPGRRVGGSGQAAKLHLFVRTAVPRERRHHHPQAARTRWLLAVRHDTTRMIQGQGTTCNPGATRR